MNRIWQLMAGGLLAMMVFVSPARAAQSAADEEEGFIPGIELARPSGGFLGLELVSNTWVVNFYDDEKKPAAVDVARAIVVWPVKYQPNPERLVLNPRGAGTLTNGFIVRPPHNFSVTISLFREGSSDAVETHTVFFNAEQVAAATAARQAAMEAGK